MRRALRPRERDARPSSGSANALTPGPRRPAGPASLSRFLRFRLPRLPRFAATASACALAAAFVLLPGAGEVQAQTEVKLVSNTGVSEPSGLEVDRTTANTNRAQAFTTGSNAAGYTVTRVEMAVDAKFPTRANASMRIHSVKSTGCHASTSICPDDSLGQLTYDFSGSTASLAKFTHSGISLKPGTRYYVVWRAPSAASSDGNYLGTNSNGQDSDGAAGWSIGDNSLLFDNFRLTGIALKMAIYGHETPATTFVSNSGQTSSVGDSRVGYLSGGNFRQAQTFTTGSNASGYTLSEVDLRIDTNGGTDDDPSTLQVSIYSVSSGGDPDSSLYVLTNPASITNDADNTFTAPANSTLDASTSYAVYLETTSTDKTIEVTVTNSDAEDSGAATGWSINNGRQYSSDGSSWSDGHQALLIGIRGTETPSTNNAPTFASAAVTRSVAENTASGGNVGAAVTATDADSDALTYTLGGADVSSFDIGASSGQITVGSGTSLNHEAKASYEVTVTASDPSSATDTTTVTINVTDVAEAPAAPGAPTVGPTSGSTTSLDVSWTAPTNTGPAITDYDWRWKLQTASTWTEKTDTTTTATSATVTGLTAGMAYHVQVRATNAEGTGGWSSSGGGTTNSPTNNAPTVATAIPDQAATAGTAFSYAFPASTFNDADNETLNYTATQSDGTALPTWLGFTDSTRTFAGTPAAADEGTVSVKVTASDGTASVSDDFDIVVSAQLSISMKLVSNDGQADGGDGTLDHDHRQSFSTGRHPSGYQLTSLALELHVASGAAPTYAVQVVSADGTTVIGTLTQQGSLTASPALIQFAAAGDGLDLKPDTSYDVVLDVTGGANANAHIGRTTSQAQDPGGAADFRISNSRSARPSGNTIWNAAVTANMLKLAVHGRPAPMVGNTGQTGSTALGFDTGADYADGFTTGSYGGGYTLTGVDFNLELGASTGTTEPDYTVSVWSSGSDGNPDSSLGELANPTSLTTGTNSFTAPGTGIKLDPDTTYLVVFDATSVGDRTPRNLFVAANDEDAGAAPGWSIADAALIDTGTGWTASAQGFSNMFAVRADRNPPLVSNTGRDEDGNAALSNDHAQGFTTGSHSDGYKLAAVDLRLGSTAATAPTYTVAVRSANASNEPDETAGGLVGTLTQQGSLASAAAYLQFTAPGDGLDLDASTDYFVLLDVTAGATSDAFVRRTGSNAEDAGAAAGWAIANNRLHRPAGNTAWTAHGANVLKLALVGRPNVPPNSPPTNSAPTISQTIALLTVRAGASRTLDLSAYFSDPEGDALTYTATSSNTAAATVSVAGATLTVRGVAVGNSTVTVTATDAGGSGGSAEQAFAVTVSAVDSGTPRGPEPLAALVGEATLTLVYGSSLDAASTPGTAAFTVTVNGEARALATENLNADPPVKPVEVKDRRVVLTLSTAVGATDTVRLTYTAGGSPIQDASGTAAANLENISVRNLAGDARGPELRGAWVQGATLTLVYDELLDPDDEPPGSAFSVREVDDQRSTRNHVADVDVVGKRVVLTLTTAVDPDKDVEVTSYVPGDVDGEQVQDFAGNLVPGIFSPVAVTHGAPPPDRPAAPPPSGGGPGDGGGGGGGTEPRNAAPEASAAIGALTLGAGGSSGVDLSARFTDPDGDELDFAAESSNPAVAAVSVDGETLTVTGIAPGAAEVTATATDPDGASATQSFTVTVTGVERVWHLPPASDPVLQGFVRVINHSDHAGEATVTATDDAGRTYDPLTLALGRRGAAHFNVHDLEMGNPAKGLTGATGPGTGGWRLAIESGTLAVEALAYARAADGFLTPLDGTAPKAGDGALALATFNPGSNWRQVSLLRLANPTTEDAEAAVAGTDDAGSSPSAPVRLTIPAGTACTVDAAELESGRGLACGAPQAGLGDGEGKWRLRIESDAPLTAMGLLRSPTGHLSNLSGGALPAGADGVRRVHMFPSASDPDGRQGFVRVVSRSGVDGTVTVRASDGTDADYEVLTLALKAGEAVQFNSDDLELGNAGKGLSGSTGPGSGDWTLALSAEGIEFDAYAYVRSRRDGFLAPMGASAPSRDVDGASVSRVAFLNPGSNWRQRSFLRLVNPGGMDADVSVEGTDDAGLRPGSPVRVTVPAGGSVELASAELEFGDADSIASGALGDGKGKWRLRIESDRPVAAQSLATSPTGRLVNLSGADGSRGFRHGLLPPPGGVTLESPHECELLGRWDAAPGAPHAVDLLKDGARDAARSAERWTHPTRRWAGLCGGTYAIRVCALNADGDCGPWSAESNPVTVD